MCPYMYFSVLNPFLTLFFLLRHDVMTFLRHFDDVIDVIRYLRMELTDRDNFSLFNMFLIMGNPFLVI